MIKADKKLIIECASRIARIVPDKNVILGTLNAISGERSVENSIQMMNDYLKEHEDATEEDLMMLAVILSDIDNYNSGVPVEEYIEDNLEDDWILEERLSTQIYEKEEE